MKSGGELTASLRRRGGSVTVRPARSEPGSGVVGGLGRTSLRSRVCVAAWLGRVANLGAGANGFQSLFNKVAYSYLFYLCCTEKKNCECTNELGCA